MKTFIWYFKIVTCVKNVKHDSEKVSYFQIGWWKRYSNTVIMFYFCGIQNCSLNYK